MIFLQISVIPLHIFTRYKDVREEYLCSERIKEMKQKVNQIVNQSRSWQRRSGVDKGRIKPINKVAVGEFVPPTMGV